MSDKVVVGYIDLLLKSKKDQAEYRFGTYDEIIQSAHQATLEKASHKKIESIMKKSLSEAGMTESEYEAVRKTIKQGILNVKPFSLSIVETSSK